MRWQPTPVGINGESLSWKELDQAYKGKLSPRYLGTPSGEQSSLENGDDSNEQASGASSKTGSTVPFAEVWASSCFHFLYGASTPEAMVRTAKAQGLTAIGLLDRDGFYGAAQVAQAAAEVGIDTVFGAELSHPLGILPVVCRGPVGYQRLSQVIARARMAAGEKDRTCYPPLEELAAALGDDVYVLLDASWIDAADTLVAAFGAASVVCCHVYTMSPTDDDNFRLLSACAQRFGLAMIVSARPNAATRDELHIAAAKHALREREDLTTHRGDLPAMGGQWIRGGATLLRAMPETAALLQHTVQFAASISFPLELIAPQLPNVAVPPGHTDASWLRHLVDERAPQRYATRPAALYTRAQTHIAHELAIISQLGFDGYFLIVCDIVDFCRRNNIYCQGRGSAANSVVCFALGITVVEPVAAGLLFERFLSPERDGPPDIDLDIESTRREEVIQYVYDTYGRDNAAQVANVITYRRKGAIRDAGRALGYPQGACDTWAKGTHEPPADVLALAAGLQEQPRHLGIHSGGMVICDRPVAQVVPTEWARKAGRSVVQWDKDDCAYAGLVKFDLLGLGMLEALHHMVDQVATHRGITIDLWTIDPDDPRVYDMLCNADAVGVFQVESRAQMATLPRLKPRCFFDLVVEVALIRPGPIQGGSVHPYIRRRNGEEPVVYDHPVLAGALRKTLGIPLFQEQLMQIARDAAGFTGAEADSLRRAMGNKRSVRKMERLKQRFFTGLAETNNITGDIAETLWVKMVAFAAYGFPESHSQSFAALVYYSAWFKYFYPAEFCVGLLRAQPMGFYSPQSLISDARRHGVTILPVSIQHSNAQAEAPNGAIRLGLDSVNGLGSAAADRIVAAREADGEFCSIADVARRAQLTVAQASALAKAGCFADFGLSRRQALWEAGVAATEQPGMLAGLSSVTPPPLPGMSAFELAATQIAATGITVEDQPLALLRDALQAEGIIPAAQLSTVAHGTRVTIAGMVTHRQAPKTAGGVTFFGMEDETGLMNIVVSQGLWRRQEKLARTAKALTVRGIVENASGAVSIVADKLSPLPLAEYLTRGSRDFR
ncbi:error-prone DNA polymerase [Corynebacterium choanae]|uniref:Error-prone DNA polymerase n=1 Tax=Corynebacterium choanae TaxID=1862358 RepID=A0A3G6JB53_9CORY|nr:error-prone DNA polymerase [Corynebacterium choanae]AZA14228.1 Error-prone DNA polymerase [Corynebacterium choanae]